MTYRLEECPECGYVLGDPREATVDVISAEPQLRGDDEEEENTQPLTARFEDRPEGGHGGAGTPFTFRLVFSEAVSATPEGLRDHALKVNNATLEAVSRVDGRSDLFDIRLTPGSNAMVTAALWPAADCDAAGAVCTAGGKMLYNGVGITIQGPPNSSATGAPAISGKARVGETLTADTSGISDADGLTQAVFSFRWVRNDGNADEDIQDATGSTLTLTDAYAGMTVWVEVFFTDDADHEEALTSAATAAVDTPATGLPAVSGTARVGDTLTADTSGIDDADGLTNVTFSYQWLADDADIAGATGSTLTLTDAYAGMTVRVEVSFTDDADHEEALTSAATAAVDTPATGLPTISGIAEVGQTLTADTSGIADEDGLDNVAFSYQWVAGGSDIDGATASSYTLTASEEGQTIQAQVTFTDDADSVEALTSAATAAVAPLPVWAADMLVVEYTSVSIGASSADLFSNERGSAGLQVKWLWSYTTDRVLRLAFRESLPGAEDLTLQVGDLTLAFPSGSSRESGFLWNDVDVDWKDGQTISVRIVLTSATVAPQPNTLATGLPAISGTARVGETLTADTSAINDDDGLDDATFSYQWMADDTNIQGATDPTYTLAEDDEGKAIKVLVSFTDDAGSMESRTSAPTDAVAAAPAQNSQATGAPTISGTRQVGETLMADTTGINDADGLDDATFSYQWMADTRTFRARRTPPTPSPKTTRARPSRCSCPSPTTRGTWRSLHQRPHR